ncbi:MAG: nitronate monooxygenase [Proteobacteria bacterium]|nr:nitronate monooxygenase [Pseudomonadota bacterium]
MPEIDTELTRMLGIRYPVIGAPMFLISYEELTVAVSEAGGLGMFPTPNYRTLEDLQRALKTIREATDKPIGVNIHLHGRFPWKEQLPLCLEAGVNFFITSLGDPRLIIDDVHKNGGKVFADVISLEHGLKARDRGVDGLVAVAAGAGGHGGTIPTIVLVPYLKKKTDLPIVAAGGISTGAQMVAAMSVGACGAITGTRLIATSEARAVEAYKQAVIDSGPGDIVCTDKLTGNRSNWIAKSIEGVETGPDLKSKKWLDLWSAGQSVAQAEEIKPAAEVIQEIMEEYFQTIKELPGQV